MTRLIRRAPNTANFLFQLFRERSSLQEEHQTSIAKIQSLRQKLENAREERDKFASDIRRLTSELSHLRSTSEARIEQLASELNDAALALDVERDGWFKRQDGFRHDFKRQNDSLQERIEALQAELEQERSQTFDYRARIEELQMQAKQSEEHIADLKRRVGVTFFTQSRFLFRCTLKVQPKYRNWNVNWPVLSKLH